MFGYAEYSISEEAKYWQFVRYWNTQGKIFNKENLVHISGKECCLGVLETFKYFDEEKKYEKEKLGSDKQTKSHI